MELKDTDERTNAKQVQPQQCNTGSAYSREWLLNELFTYHPVRLDQGPKYQAIRSAAKYFAEVLLNNTPPGADQSAAIRKIREAVMTANASVALDGLSF